MITFSCQRCATRFKVSEKLAGKKARCKKCGQTLQVPPVPAASVVATGLFRLGSVQADSLPTRTAAQAESGLASPRGRASLVSAWPTLSLGDLKAVAERQRQWEEDGNVEYELEKSVDTPAAMPAPRIAQPVGSLFWGRGGIAEVLLIALRKISDYAYLISLPCLLLMLLAIISKQLRVGHSCRCHCHLVERHSLRS